MDRRFAEAARQRAGRTGDAPAARRPRGPRLRTTLAGLLRRRAGVFGGGFVVALVVVALTRMDGPATSEELPDARVIADGAPARGPVADVDVEIEYHDDSIIQDLSGLDIPQIDPDSILLIDDCDSTGAQPVGPNGRLPASALCDVNGIPLRADAAEALARMNQAYRNTFGQDMCLGNGYRDYDLQASIHRDRPHLAAPPGQSNHGLGLAVDFCGNNQVRGTAEYTWMLENAGTYGWVLPSWAQPGGSRPEPWHWEYVGIGRIGG